MARPQGGSAAGAPVPGAADATNLAARALERGDLDAANRLLAHALAAAGKRPPVATLVNAGLLRFRQGRPGDAAALFRDAVRRDPDHLKARYNLALCLAEDGRPDEAATALALLLGRRPKDVDALALLATIRKRQGRPADAVALLLQAEQGGADVAGGLSELGFALAGACDWRGRDGIRARVRRALAPGARDAGLIDCFLVLSQEDDPTLQRAAGERVARLVDARLAPSRARIGPPARPLPAAGRRVHVAYLSADFHRHATAELLAGTIEQHDRSRFLVSCYSYGIDQATDMRSRMVAAPDRFVELGLEPPEASAARLRADGVDILVDLKGYTDSARPEIAALRAAPLQVSHLGYPGTMGAGFIDYVIGDATVLPFDAQPDWSERIVQLPHSYQPNDDRRPTPAPDTDRALHGLPADGIVFACFNNAWKITPERFALWMSLLAHEPRSVLWLLSTSAPVADNLRRAARESRIDPARLVFSPYLPLEPHLARHGIADIFLDTAPYGAHTTASNALWMGLPVVTLPGRSFASRVGASLVRACGLSDLAAGDADDYVRIARALAASPERRSAIRAHLLSRRTTHPLFDTERYTRALERAYLAMVERAARGEAPEAFAVGAE